MRSPAVEVHVYIAAKAGVSNFLRRYDKTWMILCAPGNGQKFKMTAEAKRIGEEQT